MDVSIHPAFRRRAGDGAVFTSTKCPPGPGLKSSCELPFGFLWTPMSPSSTVTVVSSEKDHGEALPPVMCLTCLAYLNLYATFDSATGMWTCPLCGERNVAPDHVFDRGYNEQSQLPLVLVSPVVEYRQRVRRESTESKRTNSCSYVIVLDGNLSTEEAEAIATATQEILREEASRGVQIQLGFIVFDQVVSMYQLGLTGIAAADVYTPWHHDETDEQLVQRRTRMGERSYFTQVLLDKALNTLWLCMTAVYGVRIQPTNGSQHTDSSHKVPLARKEQLRLRKEARLRNQKHAGVSSSQTQDVSPWTHTKRKEGQRAMRCTGEAIQCAIDLAAFGSSEPSRTSRILLFTNGCPNIGSGSIVKQNSTDETQGRSTPDVIEPVQVAIAMEYFLLAGKDASELGIGIDVFCTGSESLGMPVYQTLVEPSGGYALSHETFVSHSLARNLRFIVSQTHMSRAAPEETNGTNGWGFQSTNDLNGCLVDLRMSSYVCPTHVVLGGGEVLGDDSHGLLPNERSAFALAASRAANHGLATNNLPSEELLGASLTRIRLGRYDPLSTLSVMLQVTDAMRNDDRHAFFQCTVRYVESDGSTLVTRVSTHRLPVSRSVHDFLDGMDEEAVPVVLGKEAVYRSLVGREDLNQTEGLAASADRLELLALEAQRDLDATVHMISGAFRLLGLEEGTRSDRDLAEEGGIGASHSSLDFAFPPELADALHRLFHLRRGSMLSPGPLLSVDDRAKTRSLFLRLPLDDCLCMMAPSLWRADVNDNNLQHSLHLDPIPSDTLTLWDDSMIAADQHGHLFVWSGRSILNPDFDSMRDQCKSFLLERSKHRFPMPELQVISEGDSMSRRFTTRLAPSHADPPEQQIAHFPALASLPTHELIALRDKFRFYDASSDASFRRWFWGVASASSNARDEGMSLCL